MDKEKGSPIYTTSSRVLMLARDIIIIRDYGGTGSLHDALLTSLEILTDEEQIPDETKESILGYVFMNVANAIRILPNARDFMPVDENNEDIIIFYDDHHYTLRVEIVDLLNRVIEQELKSVNEKEFSITDPEDIPKIISEQRKKIDDLEKIIDKQRKQLNDVLMMTHEQAAKTFAAAKQTVDKAAETFDTIEDEFKNV